ncbi:MAG: hypothetical protein QGH19_03225 [Candidatus Woesearchaeota archaeon]|nr:hypothetical protein [Candidatus Woesearchaeota archaeon]
MKPFSNKKAQEGITLTQAIGIVLAVIAILALTFLIAKISAPFFNKQGYTATKNNFDELTDKVQEMLEKDGLAVERFFPYYIGKEYALMAFGKEDTIAGPKSLTVYDEQLTLLKPDFCAKKACLCFYKDIIYVVGQNGFEPLTILETKDNNVLHCKTFEGDITFFTTSSEFIGGELAQTPPTFHPGDEYTYIVQPTGVKGIQNFYMEKLEKNSKIYFYITTEDDDTQIRYNSLI